MYNINIIIRIQALGDAIVQKKNTSKTKYKICKEQIDMFAKSEETISRIWNGRY